MPDYFDSTLYTDQAAALTDYSQAPNLKKEGGTLHVLHAKVSLTGATDGDILRLAYLPPTAKVIPALSKVQLSAGPGVAVTLDVGTDALPDAYAKTIVITSGSAVAFDSTVAAQAVTPAQLTGNTLVRARVNTAGTAGAVTATFYIAYTLA